MKMVVSTSYGPAAYALPRRRSQGSVWVGSCPAPKALHWVDLCPAPKALPWTGSCPALRAESTALGGLEPRTEHAVLSGLPLTPTDFYDFRTHEPRIWIDGISAPPGRLVARVCASVATAKVVPAAGRFRLPVTPFSLRLWPYTSRAARAPQKPWLHRRPSLSRLLYQGLLHKRRTP